MKPADQRNQRVRSFRFSSHFPLLSCLPVDIIRVLQLFLTVYDFSQILATSKSYFSSVSYETVCYKFNLPLTGKTMNLKKKAIIQRLLSSHAIRDPYKQLEITMTLPSIYYLRNHSNLLQGPPCLSSLHKLTINGQNTLRSQGIRVCEGSLRDPTGFLLFYSLSSLLSIYFLELEHLIDLTCCYGLKGIKKVKISHCCHLIDVSHLKDALSVSLHCCDQLQDVSSLSVVPEVSLYHCSGIKDLSFFRNQRKFYLFNASLVIHDVSNFSKVHYLKLYAILDCDLSCLSSIYFLRILDFHKADQINLPFLSKITLLKLENVKLFDWIPSLTEETKCEIVEIGSCDINDRNLRCFSGARAIKLMNLPFIRDLSPLFNSIPFSSSSSSAAAASSNVRKLILWNCDGISDLSMLGNLYYLKIINCDKVIDLHCLGKVKILEIFQCRDVDSLHGLGNGNSSIVLSELRKIKHFSFFLPVNTISMDSYFLYKLHIDNCELLNNNNTSNHLFHEFYYHVSHLTLSACNHLSTIIFPYWKDGMELQSNNKSLRTLKSFTVCCCSQLKVIQGISLISILKISSCSSLYLISNLLSHEMLIISDCWLLKNSIVYKKAQGKLKNIKYFRYLDDGDDYGGLVNEKWYSFISMNTESNNA
jgi:hypothetical protein